MEYCERMGVDPEPENSIARAGSRCGPGQWLDADGIWHTSPCEWDDENHNDDDAEDWSADKGDEPCCADIWEEDEVGDEADGAELWPEELAEATGADEHAEWLEEADEALMEGTDEWPQETEAAEKATEWPEATTDDADEKATWLVTTEAVDDEQAEWPEADDAQAEWPEAMTEAVDEQGEWPEATETTEAVDEPGEWPEATHDEAVDEWGEWPEVPTEAADQQATEASSGSGGR